MIKYEFKKIILIIIIFSLKTIIFIKTTTIYEEIYDKLGK
jgi:hypothetical protein